jgi:beta-glucosidase
VGNVFFDISHADVKIVPAPTTTVGGTVPATLALTLGAPASFGPFSPGVTKDYSATGTATVTSSAGAATLSVADPATAHPGHLVNGGFVLPSALQADANGGAFGPVGNSPLTLLTFAGPVSADQVALGFQQHIDQMDALRTGSYSKTLTFTLSTTNP